MAERPIGITIISMLGFLGAALLIIAGIGLLALGSFMAELLGPLSALGSIAGAVVLVIGIVQGVLSYGLWKLKKWALYIEMIFLVLGILSSLMTIMASMITSVIQIIISALILYYLYTKKSLFA